MLQSIPGASTRASSPLAAPPVASAWPREPGWRTKAFAPLVALAVTLLCGVPPDVADDVGITSARLVELAEGGYDLEADVPPRMLGALRPPVAYTATAVSNSRS